MFASQIDAIPVGLSCSLAFSAWAGQSTVPELFICKAWFPKLFMCPDQGISAFLALGKSGFKSYGGVLCTAFFPLVLYLRIPDGSWGDGWTKKLKLQKEVGDGVMCRN